jgi:adenine/guanine phosphoribosyltransferase-like PRPP-binding protein
MVPLNGSSVATGASVGAVVAAASVATGACVGAGVAVAQADKTMDAAINVDKTVKVCFLIVYLLL